MALSDKEILHQLAEGNIIISPFDRASLSTSSYDVRLGEWFFREHRLPSPVFNIWNKQHTGQVWGNPIKARPASEVLAGVENMPWAGIHPDDLVIVIEPGETILGHTQEFIGGFMEHTTDMKARSSMGRVFIEVCKCAGWGDVGYVNRWTMEITNNSRHFSIPLVVGRRIAQIVFMYTGPIENADYTELGKYQTAQGLDELRRTWKPEAMLPRLYKDREILNPNGQEALTL